MNEWGISSKIYKNIRIGDIIVDFNCFLDKYVLVNWRMECDKEKIMMGIIGFEDFELLFFIL